MMRLSLESPPGSAMPATAGLTLHDASRWLWIAALKLETHTQPSPAGDGRLVLGAIPANLPPARRPVTAAETLPGLCEAVITTAGGSSTRRLRSPGRPLVTPGHLGFLAARRARRRDHGAQQRTHPGHPHPARHRPRSRPHDQGPPGQHPPRTQTRHHRLAGITAEWNLLSTGVNHGKGASQVAAEIGDLVLRIGSLAYSNPEWTPANSRTSHPRAPTSLAPTTDDLRTVLGRGPPRHRHPDAHRHH